MKKESIKLNTFELLAEYMYRKLITGGENFCTQEEFEKMLKGLNTYMKQLSYSRGEQKEVVYDELNFEKVAQNCVEKAKLWKRHQFKFENNILKATYSFNRLETVIFEDSSYSKKFSFSNNCDIKKYFHNLEIEMSKQKDSPDEVNYEHSQEELAFAKKISAYVTKDIAEKYIALQNGWPEDNTDLKYIFNKDLGKILELNGTKANFQKIYKHGTNVVLKLVKFQQNFTITNSAENSFLGYNNFYRMTNSYPDLRLEHKYLIHDNGFKIRVEGLNANIEQTRLMRYTFDDFDSFQTENIIIDSNTKLNIVERTFG